MKLQKQIGRYAGTLVGAIIMIASATSEAVMLKYDPFGSDSSIAYIVADPNDGYSHWIGWKSSSGSCSWQYLGAGPTLPDAVEIFGMGGNDLLIEPANSLTFCNYYVVPPVSNGNPIYLFGDDGNDYLVKWGNAPGFSYGGAGNDTIEAMRADTGLYGDYGVDLLFGEATSGSGGVYTGNDGNDCICINSGQSPSSVSCGDGTDQFTGPGTKPADCETSASWNPPGNCGLVCWDWTG